MGVHRDVNAGVTSTSLGVGIHLFVFVFAYACLCLRVSLHAAYNLLPELLTIETIPAKQTFHRAPPKPAIFSSAH